MMTPPPSGQGRVNGLGKGSDGREGLVRSFFECGEMCLSVACGPRDRRATVKDGVELRVKIAGPVTPLSAVDIKPFRHAARPCT